MAGRMMKLLRSSHKRCSKSNTFTTIFKRSFSSQKPYGFIGLGQMGGRMAQNLLSKSKNQVMIYDKYPNDLYKECINNGAIAAESPREIAEKCNTIVTMLRSDDQVKDVYINDDDSLMKGIANNENKLLIDSSTINFATSKYIAQFFGTNSSLSNVIIMDCPVSGGVGAAANAGLTFMCGGPKNGFEKAKNDVLQYMGKNVFHCGEPHGSGQIAKICNNLILAISMCGVSEGMNLGVKLGMDPKTLAEIVNVSSGRCWSSDTYNPCPGVMENVPPSNDYNGGFVVDLMRKDLQLALTAAQSCSANTPLASNVSQIYDMISTRGHGNKDFGFIYQFVKGADNQDKNYKP